MSLNLSCFATLEKAFPDNTILWHLPFGILLSTCFCFLFFVFCFFVFFVFFFFFFFFFLFLVMVSPDLKCSQVFGWGVCLEWNQSDQFNAHVMSVGVYGEGILVLSF
jgi:hypothetical protein